MIKDNEAGINVGGLISIFLLTIYFICWFCTNVDSKHATKVLENQGYSQIGIHGYGWFACSETDWSATKFIATFNGKTISGTVCCGLIFKNCTVRFE